MIKKVLVFIILAIVFFDIYQLNNNPLDDKKKKIINKQPIKNNQITNKQPIKNNQITNKQPIKNNLKEGNTSFSFIDNNESSAMVIDKNILNNSEQDVALENNKFIKVVSPNLFGSPSDYEEDKYIVWEFQDPKPWNKIIYKNNEKYPFYFFLKIKIPSLNDYQNWKNIIQNIDFDPRSGEIIIPTNDEETALSIANLIISNFKGELSIDDIINKNLIDISINKAKKYDIVKNKLIQQIIEYNRPPPKTIKESFKDISSFQKDLADDNKINDFNPYEGTEFSFI
jgi:hypothetical protein